MLQGLLHNVRTKHPHIHCITNYVTANDCANLLLACGGSPIMADCAEEVGEITAHCGGLLLNLGTLNSARLEAMLIAGRAANALHHPVVLDPVGAGASAFRSRAVRTLTDAVRFDVIRGNLSEIKAVFQAYSGTHGVDAGSADALTEAQLPVIVPMLRQFAALSGTVLAVTGAVDVVTDGDRSYCIRGGHPMMKAVTGTGCQLSALTAAFLTANPEQPLEAAAAAVCMMDVCGEIAFGHLQPHEGSGSYRTAILDAAYCLDGGTLARKADLRLYET